MTSRSWTLDSGYCPLHSYFPSEVNAVVTFKKDLHPYLFNISQVPLKDKIGVRERAHRYAELISYPYGNIPCMMCQLHWYICWYLYNYYERNSAFLKIHKCYKYSCTFIFPVFAFYSFFFSFSNSVDIAAKCDFKEDLWF